MIDQRVDQRAVPIAGPGMNDKAGRLGNDDQVGILIEHVERDVFTLRLRVFRRRQVNDDGVARLDFLVWGIEWRTVQLNRALFDQRFYPISGKLGSKGCRQPGVDAAIGITIGNQLFP